MIADPFAIAGARPAAEPFDEQVLVVFAIMILGPWAATHWAAMLAYLAELGPHWFMRRYLPVYRLWNDPVRGLSGFSRIAAARMRLPDFLIISLLRLMGS